MLDLNVYSIVFWLALQLQAKGHESNIDEPLLD